MQRFTDRVVIVTRAGSGIGEATARRFPQEGASVVLAGHTRSKLDRVASDLPPEGTVTEAPLDGWDKSLATNVGGVFHHTSKGAIVNFTKALALDPVRDGVRVMPCARA